MAGTATRDASIDATYVKCFLCKPDEPKMPLKTLRELHMPRVHFRNTMGKKDDTYNNYKDSFISMVCELSLAASKLSSDGEVETLVDEVVTIPGVNIENFRQFGPIYKCKLCEADGGEVLINTIFLMRQHLSFAHIADESKKEDEKTIESVFKKCFPDAKYEIPKPFSFDDVADESEGEECNGGGGNEDKQAMNGDGEEDEDGEDEDASENEDD